jgi:hypothetical protein
MKRSVPRFGVDDSSFLEVLAETLLLIVLECSALQDKDGSAEAKLLGKLCSTAPKPGRARRRQNSF